MVVDVTRASTESTCDAPVRSLPNSARASLSVSDGVVPGDGGSSRAPLMTAGSLMELEGLAGCEEHPKAPSKNANPIAMKAMRLDGGAWMLCTPASIPSPRCSLRPRPTMRECLICRYRPVSPLAPVR